jgi:hypothetical protein
MILSAVPIWMNEVVPAKNRGAFVDLHGASLLFGYALSAWLGLAFFHLQDSHNRAWRAPMGMSHKRVLYIIKALTSGSDSMSTSAIDGDYGICSTRKSSLAADAGPLR